ncbi:MAG TPA: SH3 domain-containing protein [Janthinobacterium sp.]|nr:SH3 domain-containing protein [Janthinobacterium sp.]
MQQQHLYMAGAYAAALLLTLILAAHLTPPGWWRRPTARALLILAGGTWALGALLLAWLPLPSAAPPTAPMPRTPVPALAPGTTVGAGLAYRAHRDLNLRAAAGVDSARIAVVPGGANVRTTGMRDGDWWQVDAGAPGHPHIGWTSSLWLRRIDEAAPAR